MQLAATKATDVQTTGNTPNTNQTKNLNSVSNVNHSFQECTFLTEMLQSTITSTTTQSKLKCNKM